MGESLYFISVRLGPSENPKHSHLSLRDTKRALRFESKQAKGTGYGNQPRTQSSAMPSPLNKRTQAREHSESDADTDRRDSDLSSGLSVSSARQD